MIFHFWGKLSVLDDASIKEMSLRSDHIIDRKNMHKNNPKWKLLLFTHPHVISNLYDFLWTPLTFIYIPQ